MSVTTAEPDYVVVVNEEEQYSIWRSDRELPAGWEVDGPAAGKDECLDRIETVWTDMRPRCARG
ncbi:MbtH family protein [Streptomyces sp. NPDC003863]